MPETEQSPETRRERITAHTLDAKALGRIIDQLVGGAPARDGNAGDGPKRGRWSELHRLIQVREQHYYNRPEADPVLPEPYADSPLRMQSDILRRTHVALKARLTENPVIVEVTPNREVQAEQDAAQRLETVLQRGFEQVIERSGIDPQGDLSDGQSIACFGVLHWQKAANVWPEYSDAEELDELPPDRSEAKRYRPREDDEDGKAYRETAASEARRNLEARARAGFPWHIEVLHPSMVAPVLDRSFANGLAAMLVMRSMPLLEYAERVRRDGIVVEYEARSAALRKLRIYDERERPEGWHPSADDEAWGVEVRIAQYWTRDEFYEAISDGGGGWVIVKSFPHPYEMPPFALATAQHSNHPDPVLAYEPALTGLYRTKPFFDFFLTMEKIIAANIALPMYWIKLSDDSMALDADNHPIVLTRNALSAQVLPPGASFEKIEFEMNPAFVAALERAATEMEKSAPATGQVEITATTQPWTARLGQSQANVEPALLVKQQARAFRVMFRNMALVMSKSADDGGFGAAIGVYDGDDLIAIEPDEIRAMAIDVKISPTSAAERITATEHGVSIWERRVISRRKLYEDYMQEEDPQALADEVEAEDVYQQYMRPQVIQQELARRMREFIVLNADGGFSGPGGMQMSPEQVLSANGASVQQQQGPPQMPMPDAVAGSVGGQVAMPGLPGIAPAGAAPMAGMQGF